MIRKAFRNIISISRWSLIALSIFPISSAKADTNPIITEITDFWFSYSEPTQFLAQTYQSPGFESDPQLWLYNADTDELIISNDDYTGLQSKIDLAKVGSLDPNKLLSKYDTERVGILQGKLRDARNSGDKVREAKAKKEIL